MLAELRWWWLVSTLMLALIMQPLSLQARELEVNVGGYIAAGADHYGPFFDRKGVPETTRGVLRNAKLELELAWGEAWAAELDGGYEIRGDDRDAELGDAYLKYQGVGRPTVTLGRFKEPFGLERLSSYTALSTGERSLVTSAFAPGRSQGVGLGQFRKSLTWSLGVFTDEPEGGATRAVTGRVTIAPLRTEQHTLHLGLAASWRDLGDARFQIRNRGEVFSADTVIRSPRFDARDSALIGLEGGWSWGRFFVLSEAMAQQVTRANGERWRFSGAYLQTGLFLTDDHRRYRRGEFKRLEPAGPSGAVELVARYSAVDLRDRGLGAEAQVALLGINYYAGEDVQLRLNWLMPDIQGNTLSPDPDGDAVTLRAIVRF